MGKKGVFMSRSMWTFIERKTKNGKWKPVNLYTKQGGKIKPICITPENADYNLYDAIWNNELDGAYRKIPYDLGSEASKFFDDDKGGWDNPRDYQTAWFDWIELSLLAQTPQAMVEDEWYEPEEDEEWNPPKVNGLEEWVRRIAGIIEANGIYHPLPGEIRVLCARG